MFRCTVTTLAKKARVMNAYGAFIKQVYKTNKFPAMKAKLATIEASPKAFTKRAKIIASAYKALDKKAIQQLKADGAKMKLKAPVSAKQKYLKRMQTSPTVKGLKGSAKLKALTKKWAKRQGHKI